jgi:hypothetical protein
MPRMKKNLLIAAMIVFASAGTASAGGEAGSIGVGAEFQLSGLGGLSANYDAGAFHVGGFLGFDDPAGINNTAVAFGGRFFFHVASTATSDFSVGGGIGIQSVYDDPGDPAANRLTGLFLEPSFQIRAFIASNVALSFSGGIVIGTLDAEGVTITGGSPIASVNGTSFGNITGEAGIHYYF